MIFRSSKSTGDARMTSRWMHSTLRTLAALACVALFALLNALGPAVAQDSSPGPSMDAAAIWLMNQRGAEGSFPGFDGTPDPGVTVDAVTALALAGLANELEPSLTYLEGEALVYAQTGPGSAAKLALMLVAAGLNPRDFATVDPLSIVEHAAAQGMIGFGPFDHALGLLALTAGGSAIPAAAMDAAWSSQSEEGGWAFDGTTATGAADSNTTALMIRALVAAGFGTDERVAGATIWLASLVMPDGMPYQSGGPADSNSTALAIRAFGAVGQGVSEVELDALVHALIGFQNENGSYSWMLDPRDDNIFSTVEAIPALATVRDVAEGGSTPAASPQASPTALGFT